MSWNIQITASDTHVAVDQQVTFTVTAAAAPLDLGAPAPPDVHVYHYVMDSADEDGKYDDGVHKLSRRVGPRIREYEFTTSFATPGRRAYYADLAEGANSGGASVEVTVGGTNMSFTTAQPTPVINQQVTFTVTLEDARTGAPLDKPVHIWHITATGDLADDDTHPTTDGQCQFTTTHGSPGWRLYWAAFVTDAQHMKALCKNDIQVHMV